MRKGNLLILLLAVVMGGLAAYLARNWIQAHANLNPAAPTTTVVVAKEPLGFGAVLSGDNVTEIPWAMGRVPEGAFVSKQDLLKDGRRAVLAPIQRHEMILSAKVTGAGQRASLSAMLEEGKRAVTVRVDDVRGVAGFVMPGDRVDVVLIRTLARPNGPAENVSDVLLQNVKVLAVDQLANERQDKPTVAKAVTLEVDTDQAQKILLATNIGKLSLILRQAGESNPADAKRVSEKDIGLTETVPTAAPAARTDTTTVSIFRNLKREEYKVMRSD